MNWIVLAIVAWITLGFEVGFRSALQVGSLNIAPSFVMILVTFVALWARPRHLLATGLALGMVLDMINQAKGSTGENVILLGPWALGCMLSAYMVLNFRTMVDRRHPLTLGFLSMLGSAVAWVVVLAALALHRAFYGDIVLESASSMLWQGLGSALYTGVAAWVIVVVGERAGVLSLISRWLGIRSPRNVAPQFRK